MAREQFANRRNTTTAEVVFEEDTGPDYNQYFVDTGDRP